MNETGFIENPADNVDKNSNIYITERKFNAAETAFAWACVILGYLFCLAFPPAENPLGVLLVQSAALVSATVILVKRGVRLDFRAVVTGVISFAFSFSLILTSNETVAFVALFCSAIAFCCFICAASGARFERGFSDFIVLDLFHALFVFPFYNFAKIFKAMFARKSNGMKNVFKVVIGLLVAIIPTALVVAYLSYDSGFLRIVDKIFEVLDNFDVSRHIFSLAFGCVIAMYFFGVYVSATGDEKPSAVSADDVRYMSGKIRIAPILTVASALLPVLAVYVIFFVSQWQYYVSGFTGRLPEGVISYAEYARSGFFELCSVSVINFVILIAVALFLRRNGRVGSIFLKAVSVIISLMTLVLIGTAMAKMYLYIDRFGLTEKRLLSSWFMVLLAMVFVLVIVRQFVPKLKIVSASAIVLTAMLILLVWGNHNRIIADYNVDLFISGKAETVDIEMLEGLESSSDPALVRLAEFWDSEELSESQRIEKDLKYGWLMHVLKTERVRLTNRNAFSGFSVPDSLALEAINEYFEEEQ